jgi:hypothetical protein
MPFYILKQLYHSILNNNNTNINKYNKKNNYTMNKYKYTMNKYKYTMNTDLKKYILDSTNKSIQQKIDFRKKNPYFHIIQNAILL